MSALIDANLSCLEILSGFDGSNQVKKRWQIAFTAIYCSRAFLPPLKPNELVIDVVERHPFFPDIDPTMLTTLVKEKSLDQLAKLRGVDGISTSLKTHLQCGITGDHQDNVFRTEAFGRNTYPKQPSKSLFQFVQDELKDPMIVIQLVCAALSLVGTKAEGATLLLAAFLVVSISVSSNYKLKRQFDELSDGVNDDIPVDVVRNGRRHQISIFDIVVGDIVCLKIGDQVPGDGLFIDGHSLQVDESSLTGESDQVEIDAYKNPFLISGTQVADGYAKMVVTSVGMNTLWGEMMSTTSHDSDEQTPLQAQLKKLTSSTYKVGIVVAFVVLVVLLVRYFTGNTVDENGKIEFNGKRTKVVDVINAIVGIIFAAVAIVVVAVP